MEELGEIIARYGEDEISIIEKYEGEEYELVKWIEDEVEQNPDLKDTVENTVEMVKNNPEKVVRRLYDEIYLWEEERENRKL